MAGVNKVIIIGNLGADPEIKYTPSGNVPVANLRVATTDKWQDKSSGEWQERTEWHRIVAWRHLAERAQRFLRKGKQVYIEGRLETRKWQDRDGNDRYTTEVVARELMMLGRREEGEGGGQQFAGQAQEGSGSFTPPPMDTGGSGSDSGGASSSSGGGGQDDDDLPF